MKKIEIEIPDGYEFDKETMSVIKIEKKIEYINLGLPSGTLWAKCNEGASSEEEYGDYLTFDEAKKFPCPSIDQINELKEHCTWLWVTKGNVNGYLVIGKNGNYIFLPAAGYRTNSDYAGSSGYYWSGSLNSDYSNDAYCLSFSSGNVRRGSSYCYYGLSVRTVM